MSRRLSLNTSGQNQDWEIAKEEVLHFYLMCAKEHIRDLASLRFGADWPKHYGAPLYLPLEPLDDWRETKEKKHVAFT